VVDRSEATFDSYDAVELRLEDRVVRVPPLTVGEAVRYLRLMDRLHSGDEGAHAEIMATFPGRAGIVDVPLTAWGLTVDVPSVGPCAPSVTVGEALELCGALTEAQGGAWRAQVKVLDRTPEVLGLPTLHPVEVFGAARLFAQEVYALIYGLAEDFFARLALGPRGQARVTDPAAALSSTQDSTT